jgi:hypothetical protein
MENYNKSVFYRPKHSENLKKHLKEENGLLGLDESEE